MAARLAGISSSSIKAEFEAFIHAGKLENVKHDIFLRIAEKVRIYEMDGIESLVTEAVAAGLSDIAIHDCILTSSLSCLFNRYIDGMKARVPAEDQFYLMVGERIAASGYKMTGQQ